MARKTVKRTAPAASRGQFQPQDLLLAGIGAMSLGRKQVLSAYANGFEGATGLRDRAQDAVQAAARDLGDQADSLRKQAVSLRKQAQAKSAPLRRKVVALISEARAQAESRLAPVLARLGVKAAKRPATRRKAAGSTPRRKAA